MFIGSTSGVINQKKLSHLAAQVESGPFPKKNIGENQEEEQPQNIEATHNIDADEVQNNYLKLISGTTLAEDPNSEDEFSLETGEIDTREVVISKESDYENEENSVSNADYASVDNEEIDSDEYADTLVQTFCRGCKCNLNI